MTRKQLILFFPFTALFVWMAIMCATPPTGITPATEADQVAEAEDVQELLRKALERDKEIEREEAEKAAAEFPESKVEEPTEDKVDPLATKTKPPHHKPETKSRGTYDPQRGVNVMTQEESRQVICEFFGECDFSSDGTKKVAPARDTEHLTESELLARGSSAPKIVRHKFEPLDRGKQEPTPMGGARRSPGVVIERIPFKPRARD